MNTNSIRNAIFAISVVLLLIYVVIPSSRPLFSYLVVIVLVIFTIKLTWDGIKIKEKLKNEVKNLEQTLKYEISDFYQQNNNKYEQVNRLALIDNKCAENNKFISWEKEKRYYQFLPSFLLSIGLFGTFTGITMNLFLIGINTGGTIDIQTILPDIISSMAIAFISSLVALGCSMFLTKFHPISELELAKENLVISLEYYLDNDFLLKQNNPTLTDKIDKLITTIDVYAKNLSAFHQSFPQITIDFKNAVINAANTFNTSANNFQAVIKQCSDTMEIAANALIDATNSTSGLTTRLSNLISSLETTTNNLQDYTTNLDTVSKNLINNSKQVHDLIESNEEKMIEVLNSILSNSQTIFTSTQSLNQNITQVTTSLKDHIVKIQQQSKVLYNLTVMIQTANENINQASGSLEKTTPLLDNQINKLQILTNQLNQTTQIVYQVNDNLAGLLNSSQKSQQSNN